MLPPGVAEKFEDNNAWVQALLISYSQIRDIEEDERMAAMLGATVVKAGAKA